MPKKYRPIEISDVLKEAFSAPARAGITVVASLLDHMLEEAITAILREPANETEKAMICSEHGILGSFSEKIWGAYFLNIIGPETRRSLDMIRLMRNELAHDMNPATYETDHIKARMREITADETEWPLSIIERFKEALPDNLHLKFFTKSLILFIGLSAFRLMNSQQPIHRAEYVKMLADPEKKAAYEQQLAFVRR
jgi:hypothetical protein